MADITIVNGVYKPTYNWGAPSCSDWTGGVPIDIVGCKIWDNHFHIASHVCKHVTYDKPWLVAVSNFNWLVVDQPLRKNISQLG